MPRHHPIVSRGLVGCALCACAAAVLASGCRTLSGRSPVSQSVAVSRQLTQQGIAAMERGDWKRAESVLSRAVQTNADAEARRHYAEALWHRGARNEALTQMEEARKLAGEDPGLVVRCGEMYLALGQVSQAVERAEEALRLDPKHPQAWALRGQVASTNGRPREALADYQRALGYAPDDTQLALLVAEAYRQLNEPERALTALQALGGRYAAGEEPQQVLYLQGLALGALGRHDDAARCLAHAARRDRPSGEILYRLAEAEVRAGHAASAQLALQQALAVEPDHAPSRALSAQLSSTAQASTGIRR